MSSNSFYFSRSDASQLCELAGDSGVPALGAAVPGRPNGGIPSETGEPRGGCSGGRASQVLLSPETLHQSHHKTEVGDYLFAGTEQNIESLLTELEFWFKV